jgi:hypothetical protein
MGQRPPSSDDAAWAESWLTSAEASIFHRMGNADRRHSIAVARRVAGQNSSDAVTVAAALLHDAGKAVDDLPVWERIGATCLGGRRARWRRYLDHENIGISLLHEAGARPDVVDILRGTDPRHHIVMAADDA